MTALFRRVFGFCWDPELCLSFRYTAPVQYVLLAEERTILCDEYDLNRVDSLTLTIVYFLNKTIDVKFSS